MTKERKDKIIHLLILITTLIIVYIAGSLFIGRNVCEPRIQEKDNNVYAYQARVFETQIIEIRSFGSYEAALRHCTGAFFEYNLHYQHLAPPREDF